MNRILSICVAILAAGSVFGQDLKTDAAGDADSRSQVETVPEAFIGLWIDEDATPENASRYIGIESLPKPDTNKNTHSVGVATASGEGSSLNYFRFRPGQKALYLKTDSQARIESHVLKYDAKTSRLIYTVMSRNGDRTKRSSYRFRRLGDVARNKIRVRFYNLRVARLEAEEELAITTEEPPVDSEKAKEAAARSEMLKRREAERTGKIVVTGKSYPMHEYLHYAFAAPTFSGGRVVYRRKWVIPPVGDNSDWLAGDISDPSVCRHFQCDDIRYRKNPWYEPGLSAEEWTRRRHRERAQDRRQRPGETAGP